MNTPVLQQAEVLIRHVYRDDTSGCTLLGKGMTGRFDGVNGRDGWQKATIERRLGEEAAAAITFPNTTGSDGRLHRERFAIITDRGYRPGDEWVEIYLEHELLFVGTPASFRLSRSTLEIALFDGLALLKKQRDTAAAFNLHGPRDLIAEYCSAWQVLHAEAPNEVPSLPYEPVEFVAGHSEEHWQITIRAQVDLSDDLNYLQVSLAGTSETHVALSVGPGAQSQISAPGGQALTVHDAPLTGEMTLTLEGRGRWLYGYINGTLVGIVACLTDTDTVTLTLDGFEALTSLDQVLVRQRQPFLRDEVSTHRLPGVPPATGVRGSYVTNVEDNAADLSGWEHQVLTPTRKPFATEQRTNLQLTRANPPAWVPAGGSTNYFAARWVGAIYLPLDDYDIALRLYDVDNVARMWVGKTRFDDAYIDTPDWAAPGGDVDGTLTGTWLLAGSSAASAPSGSSGHLAGQESGWYPLIIELRQLIQHAGLTLEHTRSDDPGTWEPVGAETTFVDLPVRLSPIGVVEQHARYDSFYEQIQAITDAFGYQITVEPRSLESGEFPGILRVAERLGRDTDKEIVDSASTGIQVEVNAEEIADALLVDGSGISDTEQAAQLTLEAYNVDSLDEHVIHHQDVESLADITDLALLEQRATSIALLRDSAWEQVTAQPPGTRELRDTFPLTGELAELRWEPGDGIRLNLPEISVVDYTPRQIMGVQWPLVPAGIGAPTIAFRQRPRGARDTLRRLQRQVALGQRSYQGQVIAVTGSIGSWDGTTPGGVGSVDQYSLVGMPANDSDIIAAWLVVGYIFGAVSETIEINGVDTGITVNAPGRYPITAYAKKDPTQPARMYANLTTPSAGQKAWYQLELHVRT